MCHNPLIKPKMHDSDVQIKIMISWFRQIQPFSSGTSFNQFKKLWIRLITWIHINRNHISVDVWFRIHILVFKAEPCMVDSCSRWPGPSHLERESTITLKKTVESQYKANWLNIIANVKEKQVTSLTLFQKIQKLKKKKKKKSHEIANTRRYFLNKLKTYSRAHPHCCLVPHLLFRWLPHHLQLQSSG